MSELPDEETLVQARYLLSAPAVRERSNAVFARIENGESDYFAFSPDALPAIARRVAELTRQRFPDLSVPLHSRWRHFEVGGIDRFSALAGARGWSDPAEAARAMGDLAVVSVLLDAGAGPRWRYHEASTGLWYGRSEGLAVASLAMFAAGTFSAVPADPLRVDAAGLDDLNLDAFARGFQSSADNLLDGLEGRHALLPALARALRLAPDLFAVEDDPRPGGIIDALAAEAGDGPLPAATILSFVLEGFGPVWPSRESLAGIPLGDVWPLESLDGDSPGAKLVPFHKLSTWLSLSLVEPLLMRGVDVVELDGLPGLAEYRNGGLFLDGGALTLKRRPKTSLPVSDPQIVEWRAATVALLDRLAPLVRAELGVPDLPLGAILEGGTWLAGRKLAFDKRADGTPPLDIASDGTVF